MVSSVRLLVIGLAGSAMTRRTMKPLEQLAEIATKVSRLPLDGGVVAQAVPALIGSRPAFPRRRADHGLRTDGLDPEVLDLGGQEAASEGGGTSCWTAHLLPSGSAKYTKCPHSWTSTSLTSTPLSFSCACAA